MWQLHQFPLCPFSRKLRLLMGEKNVAIEWDSLELTRGEDNEEYVISVNASEEALQEAQEYERNDDLRTERDTEMNNSEDNANEMRDTQS